MSKITRGYTKIIPVFSFSILVPRGRAPFGQHQESRTSFGKVKHREVYDSRISPHSAHAQNQVWQSDWLIIRNDFCVTFREVTILCADQNGLWGRECCFSKTSFISAKRLCTEGKTKTKPGAYHSRLVSQSQTVKRSNLKLLPYYFRFNYLTIIRRRRSEYWRLLKTGSLYNAIQGIWLA